MEQTSQYQQLVDAADAQQLGPVVSAHEGQSARQQTTRLIIVGITALVVVGLAIFGLQAPVQAPNAIALIVGGILTLVAGYTLIKALVRMAQGSKQVAVFERGLVEGRGGKPVLVAPFTGSSLRDERITWYKGSMPAPTEVQQELRLADGQRWKLSGPTPFRLAVGPAVAQQQAQVRLPELAEELRNGGQVDFGPLVLTPTGVLTRSGAEVPYQSLTSWVIEAGGWELAWGDGLKDRVAGAVRDTENFASLAALIALQAPQLGKV
ncbi:DUF6585 family protein [Tessaracoccus massiliensis]|uniref:DUF6585 family protein n=1 Tax=Tessaracoccus massiliensis TaxID=1522311 RepID=UPI00058F7525|nr:DUF6585 family protein [Tessaracoccus massiliensis]